MMRTPNFKKQRPEMINQHFLRCAVRVRAALLGLMQQRGLSAAVDKHRSEVLGETSLSRELHSLHFHPPKSSLHDTLLSLPVFCLMPPSPGH